MNITKDELCEIFGLPPDATDDDIRKHLKAGAQAIEDIVAERTKSEAAETDAEAKVAAANADCDAAKAEADAAKKELENERQAHADTKTELANEKAKYKKLEALKTKSVTMGLPNEQQLAALKSDSEKRMALVNEYQAKGMKYADAWAAAKAKNPELFKN